MNKYADIATCMWPKCCASHNVGQVMVKNAQENCYIRFSSTIIHCQSLKQVFVSPRKLSVTRKFQRWPIIFFPLKCWYDVELALLEKWKENWWWIFFYLRFSWKKWWFSRASIRITCKYKTHQKKKVSTVTYIFFSFLSSCAIVLSA